ncbi:DUF547 domain-containing protein [Formosa sp. 4Alg 33]|uniref:DUF547 domain-containing protein n=1 Tax=Formosa sp. 4Alg 33 TaxID=3382189 RepID=UPI003D9C4B4C
MIKNIIIAVFICCTTSLFAQQIDHTPWTTFLTENVDPDGHVNYKTIKQHPDSLNRYLDLLSASKPDSSWTKNETLAFWINAYNAFTIKLIIDNYPLKSIKDIKNPWDKKFISIHNKSYSLGDIEHEILRKLDEPRIHFAIVCASESCPKLLNKAYTPTQLNTQLDAAAVSFINSNKNQLTPDAVKLSKIFKWFTEDFETNGTLVEFINKYAKTKINPTKRISYLDYNWNLNE